MYGDRQGERFDPLQFETPFAEYFDEAEAAYPSLQLNLDVETFATEPASEAYDGSDEDLSWIEDAVQTAEAQAARADETEWLETEWLEAASAIDSESVESFTKRLGNEWSRRRNGDPGPDAMRAWLLKDHDEVLAGARLRWKTRKPAEDFWTRVTQAWMVSREEQMRFQTERLQGVKPLGRFAPPSAQTRHVSDRLIEGSDKAPVAPLTLRFARALMQRFPGVSITNYRGHGGGAFLNRGYSLDLFIPGRDTRGFYRRDDAIRLLRAIHAAAGAVQADWRVIYNDFSVAEAVNKAFGRNHVIFVGNVRRTKAKKVTGLNWHGPDPLILHFHLDLSPRAAASLDEAEDATHEHMARAGCGCASASARGETGEWIAPHGEEEEEGEAFDESWNEDEYGSEAEYEDEGDTQESGRYDEPEPSSPTAREQFDDFESFDHEAGAIASAGLSAAERKALEITSTLETGKRGGFYGLSGNFDGQGLSFGLVNWTIGTGSLQPLLRDFAREQPARWTMIFGSDADRFLRLITPNTSAARREQHRFAIEQMNERKMVRGRTVWTIREPWQTYFRKLSEDSAFREIQIRYVRDLLRRAAYLCRLFGLKSERAFAFMFDAVSSHGKWWLTKKFGTIRKRKLLIDERMRPLEARYGNGRVPERDVLLLIADVLGETSAARWANKVRARKRWFVTGQHPRARELAGLEPAADRPWTAAAVAQEAEDSLAWTDLETIEAEPETDSESFDREDEGGPEALHIEAEQAFDSEGVWQPGTGFMESLLEAAGSIQPGHDFVDHEDSGASDPACTDYPAGYAKIVRRKGTLEGELLDRTTGDRTTSLSLQFRDYDVNAYLAGTKSRHAAGLAQLTEFIRARLLAGATIEVTITGSASKTGTAQFNQDLSEKRARCMASMIRTSLTPGEVARIRFNEKGEGFTAARCDGADCELPGYRSVLVSVHAAHRPPPPVPPEPAGWDKYEIRICALQSIRVGDVIVDDLLNKLPGGLPRAIAEKLTPVLKKRLETVIRKLLQRLPKLGALAGDLGKLLKFLPVQVIRQKAVFQIRERGKADPQLTTLCYDGWGGRLDLPIPGTLDDALDEMLKRVPGIGGNATARNALKKVIREELERILPQRVTRLMAKLDSIVAGPWKPFDLNHRAPLSVFEVDADIFVDVITNLSAPGQIMLAFDGGPWSLPDPARRIRLSCAGCATSVIPLQVDGGNGFELLSVNKGTLLPRGCACSPEASEAEIFAFT